jgi:hypothetical protein
MMANKPFDFVQFLMIPMKILGWPYPDPRGRPPNNAQPFNETRRNIDLEIRVAKLEAEITNLDNSR